jgi:hypothetical protein
MSEVFRQQLKEIVRFQAVQPGQTVQLPHNLRWYGHRVTPDFIIPDRGGFAVTGDDVNVIVTNNLPQASDLDCLCESWWTPERSFGAASRTSLVPKPYVPNLDGTGAGVLDEKVKVSAADQVNSYLFDKVAEGLGIDFAILAPGLDEDLQISADVGEIEANLTYGVPITVRGPTNAAGANDVAHADHDHRLEYEVEDEGVLQSARPRMNFIGAGVGAVDNPGQDRTDVTIPGNVTDGAVVKRSQYLGNTVQTSSNTYVDGMSGTSIVVPIDGDYWAHFEGEAENQSGSGISQVGVSVDSLVAVVANSERRSQGNASDVRNTETTVQLPGLTAGQLVRLLFRKQAGAGTVALHARHLTIIKVQ